MYDLSSVIVDLEQDEILDLNDAIQEVFFEVENLQHQVVIYVPSTLNVNIKISDEEVKRFQMKTIKTLTDIAGGSTTLSANGYWFSTAYDGMLVEEDILLVYAYIDLDKKSKLKKIRKLCELLKAEMSQEFIGLSINNQLFFI
jgi:hypothetical protein